MCAILGGVVIDVFTWMLEDCINVDSPMLVRVVSMLAGCVILSVGMSIVINSNGGLRGERPHCHYSVGQDRMSGISLDSCYL